MSTATPRRLPRAGLDPIRTDATALAVVLAAAAVPARAETILVLLDDGRRGLGLVAVSGTHDPEAVVRVAQRFLDPVVHDGLVAAAIIASIRPDPVDDTLCDADRWLDLDDVADQCQVELLEWFVVDPRSTGAGVTRPRELVHAPPRW